MVVILAVGTADQRGSHPCYGGDLFVAGGYISDDLVAGKGIIVVVVVGVAHDLMPRVMERFHRLGIFIHPIADHEKGGLDIVFGQNVDQSLRILVAPGCVKGDGADFFVPFHAINGELACGGCGRYGIGVGDHIEDAGDKGQHPQDRHIAPPY